MGTWDAERREFTPSGKVGNAVRVTARRDAKHGGEVPLFFARALRVSSFSTSASAVAMATPRDIAFVVDLSGSMNDDTEPCWATGAINSEFGPEGYPTVGNELMEKVFDDFRFGSYPGTLEYFGAAVGRAAGQVRLRRVDQGRRPADGEEDPGGVPHPVRATTRRRGR